MGALLEGTSRRWLRAEFEEDGAGEAQIDGGIPKESAVALGDSGIAIMPPPAHLPLATARGQAVGATLYLAFGTAS